MGGLPCCGSRPTAAKGVVGKPAESKAPAKDDTDAFYEAFHKSETSPDKAIIDFLGLMDSTDNLVPFGERMHPWAQDPKTVGCLAGLQICILIQPPASIDPDHMHHIDGGNKDLALEIRREEGVPKYVEFLKDKSSPDKVECAHVFFSFLCELDAECTKELYKLDGLGLVIPHMNAANRGMRTAAAHICRHLFMLHDEAKQAFTKAGGVPLMVEGFSMLVNSDIDNEADRMDVIAGAIDGILNFEDLIDADEMKIDWDISKMLVEHGLIDLLETTKRIDPEDDELLQQANHMISTLEDADKLST